MATQPNQTTTIPGTNIPVPVGSGIETLTGINPPFRSNAPAWYANGVWGQLGCAVPQPGRYLQTTNGPIFDFVTVTGRQLFQTMWQYPDRKFERFPSRDCLFEIYQMLLVGRKRLADNTVLPGASPLEPTHAKPAPQMFLVYPAPIYGPLGCVNQWLRRMSEMVMLMLSEAMQHSDNELSYFYTKDFHDTVYGYVKYLLVNMATKFFGYTVNLGVSNPDGTVGVITAPAAAGVTPMAQPIDGFVLSAADWSNYNPAQFSVSVEGTSSRPPMGYTPTDLDLEPIRGLPIEQVIPFLQPWPDSQLVYSSGGIWANSQPPAGTTTPGAAAPAAQQATAQTNSAIYASSGPPNAPAVAPSGPTSAA